MTHQLNFIYNDSDWIAPAEYPDLSKATEIAIDLETKDPNIKTKGPGWATFDGHIVDLLLTKLRYITEEENA